MNPVPALLIVIPTYQERDNIEPLVELLERARSGHPFDVLVVDDGSPDGTATLVREAQRSHQWLHLVERSGPMGLGSAYREGFLWGRRRGYSRIGEMDADLSHDPSVIPALDEEVRAGADLAIGSRYVPGGGAEGWPLRRRVLSKGANRFARTLLRLPPRDVTAGFRIYAGRAIDLVLTQGTGCDGYGFQVEGVTIVWRAGMAVREVPITFRERERGASKMSRATVIEAARRCVSLAWQRPAALESHGIVGTAAAETSLARGSTSVAAAGSAEHPWKSGP